ncbi:MAG TPA: hypothetical protein VNG12_13870 [Acidimicrobiales bacterium]|nr:hypothetical protein [Acidimicrobiales bacterium]
MPRSLSRSEIEQLAASIDSLLDRIRAGELEASTANTYRLEGAVVALRVALGERSADLGDALLRKPG